MPRRRRTILLTVVALLLLAACAPGANDLAGTAASSGEPAGFWLGLWHGFICPITVIVSIFNKDVGIYEAHNIGLWYDIPFVVGVSIFFNAVLRPARAVRSAQSGGRGARRRTTD